MLHKRERWGRDQIQRHQQRELTRLRQFIAVHSPAIFARRGAALDAVRWWAAGAGRLVTRIFR